MAQLTYRVSGISGDKRITRRFRNTAEGRQQATEFAKSVDDPRRFYDVRVRIDGRPVTRSFGTRKEADDYAAETEAGKVQGTAIDPKRGTETFSNYADRWIETRRVKGRPLAPKTRELYETLLRVHIKPAFGARPIGSISAEDVRQWYATFDSPLTAAKCYRLLRGIMNTAAEDRRIKSNPCKIKGAGDERSPEREIVGADVILALAEKMGPRYRPIVLLAGFGGLRIGETLGLRRRHVDLEDGSVRIDQQVVTLAKGQRLVTDPKTEAGVRTVHLNKLVVDELRDHLATAVGPEDDALLFQADGGGLLPVTTLYKAWRVARESVGRPKLHIHDLRHSAGTLAAWTGATQRELMERMGHASHAAAMRYQHAATDRDKAIARGLDAILEAMADRAAR